jgi:hypothetical protein
MGSPKSSNSTGLKVGTAPAGRNGGDGDSRQTSPRDSALPTLTLPKGGGAIRGIGDKFAANPVTGSGKLTVPLRLSQSRSNFTPDLNISYDSSSGNSAFGFGWATNVVGCQVGNAGLPRTSLDRIPDNVRSYGMVEAIAG